MPEKMPYQPSEEEIRAAEAQMNPEQKVASHFRSEGDRFDSVWFDFATGEKEMKLEKNQVVFRSTEELHDGSGKYKSKEVLLSPDDAIKEIETREAELVEEIANLKIKIDQLGLFRKRIEAIKQIQEK